MHLQISSLIANTMTKPVILEYSCEFVWCWLPSLMRGQVYSLQSLPVFSSTISFWSQSCGTHNHIYISQKQSDPDTEFPFGASFNSQGCNGSIRPAPYKVTIFISQNISDQSSNMTSGQSTSLNWRQPCILGPWRIFFINYLKTVANSLWGALSFKRMGPQFLQLTVTSGPCYSPNLESQVPVLISPRNKVDELYPQALGNLKI